jgi:hypothetical protein
LLTSERRENRGPADGAVVVATTNLLAALVLDNEDNFWRGSHLFYFFFSFILFILFFLGLRSRKRRWLGCGIPPLMVRLLYTNRWGLSVSCCVSRR